MVETGKNAMMMKTGTKMVYEEAKIIAGAG